MGSLPAPLIQIEALVVERINDLNRDSVEAYIEINQNHVKILNLGGSRASALSINQAVALAVSYLRELEILDCFDNRLSSLPYLPGSLRRIDIGGTPAFKDPNVWEKLKAFQEAHPETEVLF